MIDAGTLARVDRYLDIVYDLRLPKSVKEEALAEVRRIEREAGERFIGDYNTK